MAQIIKMFRHIKAAYMFHASFIYLLLISKLIKGKFSYNKLFYLIYISPRLTEEYLLSSSVKSCKSSFFKKIY